MSSYTGSHQFSNKVTQLLLVDGILGHEFIYRKLMVNYCITRSQIKQAEMIYNNMVNHCNGAPVLIVLMAVLLHPSTYSPWPFSNGLVL